LIHKRKNKDFLEKKEILTLNLAALKQ